MVCGLIPGLRRNARMWYTHAHLQERDRDRMRGREELARVLDLVLDKRYVMEKGKERGRQRKRKEGEG